MEQHLWARDVQGWLGNAEVPPPGLLATMLCTSPQEDAFRRPIGLRTCLPIYGEVTRINSGTANERSSVMLVLARKLGEKLVVPSCGLTITILRVIHGARDWPEESWPE